MFKFARLSNEAQATSRH